MSDDPFDGYEEPTATLLSVIADPAAGERRLPRLVGLLDSDDAATRVGAAWALCLVADGNPDLVAYLTRRLADRRTEDDEAPAVDLIADYLAARFPDRVEDELDAIAADAAGEPGADAVGPAPSASDGFRREVGGGDDGRTREAGEDTPPASQGVHTRDAPRDADERTASGGSPSAVTAEDADSTDRGDGGGESSDIAGASDDFVPGEIADVAADRETAAAIEAVRSASTFDQLRILDRRSDRYAEVYRSIGTRDGEDLPVGLALFHRPSENRAAFASSLDEQLARWADVDDHDNVVTVYDRGTDPRPWAAVEFAGTPLLGRDALPTGEALWNACQLASAVGYVHENGVVHGGIDPANVRYFGNAIDDERQPPLLTAVGLMHVVRQHFDPTTRLDPRYAAPEYFDREYGRVDHATDVYHLGAVIYRLFTGRPPYGGSYGRVRENVLTGPAPRPSDVAAVPAGIDDVVTKAMARQKLRRYETVSHLERELRSIDAGDLVGGADRAPSVRERPAATSEGDADRDGDDGGPARDDGDGGGPARDDGDEDPDRADDETVTPRDPEAWGGDAGGGA